MTTADNAGKGMQTIFTTPSNRNEDGTNNLSSIVYNDGKCGACGQYLSETKDEKKQENETESSLSETDSEDEVCRRYKWIRCQNGVFRAKCSGCNKVVDECPQCHTAFEEEDEPDSEEESDSEDSQESEDSDEEEDSEADDDAPKRKRQRM